MVRLEELREVNRERKEGRARYPLAKSIANFLAERAAEILE